MNREKLIEWVGTGDIGISSMTMWCALMGVNRMKDIGVPRDISDFTRCYGMVQMGQVSFGELQKVKSQYPWFAPFIDNWRELSLLYEEELDGRLYGRIRQLCEVSDSIMLGIVFRVD